MAEGAESSKNLPEGSVHDLKDNRTTKEVMESVSKLTKLRDFLQSQYDECLIRRAVSNHQSTNTKSREDLTERIQAVAKELTERKANLRLQSEVLESSKFSEEIYKSFYPNQSPPCPDDPELSLEQQHQIRTKMVELHELNKQMLKMNEEKRTLRLRSLELDNEIQEIVEKNRKTMETLKETEENNDEDAYPKEEQEKIEYELSKLRRTKHIFQCMIMASGIDMYDDDELRSLVIELGKPESMMLTELQH